MIQFNMAKIKLQNRGFTFSDVLIKPAASSVQPGTASLETHVTRGNFLTLPFLSAAMDKITEEKMAITLGKLGGLGVLHRNCTIGEQVKMVKKVKAEKVVVGAACGPFDLERAIALEKAGCDFICVDCAHGHNLLVIKSAKEIKKKLKRAKLIFGNIATAGAAKAVCTFADAVKVGVGPGSICTTRMVSGVGVPQLSAIIDVASVAQKKGVPVIADGGMTSAADIAKALAAGASAVMLGNMFAGTDETPGKIIKEGGKLYKEYRGMGSKAVIKTSSGADRYLTKGRRAVPEGVSALVPYRGSLVDIVEGLASSIQVTMGYVGAKNISQLQRNVEFIIVSKATVLENGPHDLAKITG